MGNKIAMEIYKSLLDGIFEEDNYLMNNDVVDQYVKLLCKEEQWKEVIDLKKRVQKYLRDSKTIDH